VKEIAITCKSFIRISRLSVNGYRPIIVGAKKCFMSVDIAVTRRFAMQLFLIHKLIYFVDEEKLR
jgi:hypothetical protein